MITRHLLPAVLLLSMISFMSAQTPSGATNTVSVRLVGSDGKPGPVTEVTRVVKNDVAWEKQLGPEAYRVLRAKGTEASTSPMPRRTSPNSGIPPTA